MNNLVPQLALVLSIVSSCAWSAAVCAQQAEGERAPDVVRGAKSWANNCARCHNMRDASEFRDDLWRPILSHMRLRAGLTGKQTRDILAFMQASNYQATAQPVRVALTAADATETHDGKAIYLQTCVACHGPDGKGALPGVPDFTDPGGPLSKTDDVLLKHIIEGFKSPNVALMMPARGGNPALTDAELAATLAYLRQSFGQ